MESIILSSKDLEGYVKHLKEEEKSPATIEKYARYTGRFAQWAAGRPLEKELIIGFKADVVSRYSAAGANGMLAAVNSLLDYLGCGGMKVRLLRVQRRLFCEPQKELSRQEANRLVSATEAIGRTRLGLIIQTLFGTGIRISELQYITVAAVREGKAEIHLKGKIRLVFLPTKLCRLLEKYARQQGIRQGPLFVTRSGRPVDRSNTWRAMKGLCGLAKVAVSKVFPHNLRHLFARTYYSHRPDIVELASLMGHSDVNTTRIYTATTGTEYQKRLDELHLIL